MGISLDILIADKEIVDMKLKDINILIINAYNILQTTKIALTEMDKMLIFHQIQIMHYQKQR